MKKNLGNLLSRFKEHLREKRFFKTRQKILIACSGGPDSVALFHLLRNLTPEYSWKLGLAHFNHRLRPVDARNDERFVRALALKYKVPFFGGRGDVKAEAKITKRSIEEAARYRRYDFLLRTARGKKFHTVVLAHTRNDQAETVLMRVLQGTGLRGLQGIREKFRKGGVSWVRPLLVFTKQELLNYLFKERIPFRLDKSNNSSRFVRNRIRLKLIPELQRDFNPRVVEALSRIPEIVAVENGLIEELEEQSWRKVFKKSSRKKVELRRLIFLKLFPALQFRIMEKALKKLDKQSGLSFEAWERIRRGLTRPRFRCSLPKDIDLALTPQSALLFKK